VSKEERREKESKKASNSGEPSKRKAEPASKGSAPEAHEANNQHLFSARAYTKGAVHSLVDDHQTVGVIYGGRGEKLGRGGHRPAGAYPSSKKKGESSGASGSVDSDSRRRGDKRRFTSEGKKGEALLISMERRNEESKRRAWTRGGVSVWPEEREGGERSGAGGKRIAVSRRRK